MENTKPCVDCSGLISPNSKECPHCGSLLPHGRPSELPGIIAMLVVGGVVLLAVLLLMSQREGARSEPLDSLETFLHKRSEELSAMSMLHTHAPFWQAIRTMCIESHCNFPFPNNDKLYSGDYPDVTWYSEAPPGADTAPPDEIPPYLNLIWLALQDGTKESKRLDELITDEDTKFDFTMYKIKRRDAHELYKRLTRDEEK